MLFYYSGQPIFPMIVCTVAVSSQGLVKSIVLRILNFKFKFILNTIAENTVTSLINTAVLSFLHSRFGVHATNSGQ